MILFHLDFPVNDHFPAPEKKSARPGLAVKRWSAAEESVLASNGLKADNQVKYLPGNNPYMF